MSNAKLPERASIEYLKKLAKDRLRELRRADPRLTLSLAYATVVGVATEPEALRIFGWEATPAGLRHLRTELLAFLRSSLVAG